MKKPKRYETEVLFKPKPKVMPLPSAILVKGRIVGEVISYNCKTGKGKAMIDGNLTVPDLVLLTVGRFRYKTLSIGDKEVKL